MHYDFSKPQIASLSGLARVRASTNLHRRHRVKYERIQADGHITASSFLRIPF